MSPISRARPIVALAMTLTLAFTAGCSSDKKDDSAQKTTTPGVNPTDEKFCEAARKAQNLPTSQGLEGAEAQAAVAPKELEAQFDRYVEVLKFADANPDQQAEINVKIRAVSGDIADIITYSVQKCGITFDLGG